MTTVIYTISCPISKRVVYVGKTSCLHTRAQQHLYWFNEKTKLSCWIFDLKKINQIPIFEEIDRVSADEYRFWEQFYIELMKVYGFELLNMKTANSIRSHRNHPLLYSIKRLGFTFESFCKVANLDYAYFQNTFTLNSNFNYSQSLEIYKSIQYVKNNPGIRNN